MLLPASQVSRFESGTPKAINDARAMQENSNSKATILVSQDAGREADYMIYLYNVCVGWEFPPVQQPPTFPSFKIPTCKKGEKFAFTTLPAFVNNPIERPGAVEGTTEITYRRVDGREAANSLVNPDAHPRNPFEAQFRNIEKFGNRDQTGNNLNAFGIFWSMTTPDDPKLKEELDACRARLNTTMRGLVEQGNNLNAQGNLKDISPLMHFAMEYFNLEADWHKSHEHRVPCPNCGMPIREGLAYHKNEFGDRCIIDHERYQASIVKEKTAASAAAQESDEEEPVMVPATPATKKKARTKSA